MVFTQTVRKPFPETWSGCHSVQDMSPRQSQLGPPNTYVEAGAWPDARLTGPRLVLYAQAFARRLQTAIDQRPVREVARLAEISHSTLLAVMGGARWPDMVTIAKLEEALDADLWPGVSLRTGQDRPAKAAWRR